MSLFFLNTYQNQNTQEISKCWLGTRLVVRFQWFGEVVGKNQRALGVILQKPFVLLIPYLIFQQSNSFYEQTDFWRPYILLLLNHILIYIILYKHVVNLYTTYSNILSLSHFIGPISFFSCRTSLVPFLFSIKLLF